MSRAAQVKRTAHTAGQVRRAAQAACAGMTREHRIDRDTFTFTDGSSITVTGKTIKVG